MDEELFHINNNLNYYSNDYPSGSIKKHRLRSKSFKSIKYRKPKIKPCKQKKVKIDNGKQRLINQVTSGLNSENNLIETVKCIQCTGLFTCESSELSDWNIELKYNPDTQLSYFECGCGIGSKSTIHCKHISAVLIKLIQDQAKLINKEEEQNINSKNLADVITSLLNTNI